MNLSGFKNLSIGRMIGVSAGATVLTCLIIYFLIAFTVNDIKNLHLAIVAQKLDIEKQADTAQSLSVLSEKLKTVEPQMEKLDYIFINKNRELEFITTLEEAAGKNNVTQKINLTPPTGQKKDVYDKTALSIDAQGSFADIMNYLAELEALNYYFNINLLDLNYQTSDSPVRRVTIESGEENTKNPAVAGNVSLRISGETYWQ
ncbi:MAG: type 4a pilus biogenesis protein PilO [Candidatus Falkowbacteria bacterium]